MKVELQLNCTGGWVDYTNSVNINKLVRELSLNAENDPIKEQTGSIEVYGDAYQFISTYLISSVDMYSNSMCVRITDSVCTGEQYLFKIDNRNLKWCDDEGCTMQFEMQEYDTQLDCARLTAIADNTNNLFDQFGPIVHPRFRYCDVFKPLGFLVFLLTLASVVDLIINFINNTLIAAINLIPGVNVPTIGTLGPALQGCRLSFPAPFISTYITNVCNLCGLTADQTTAPIFYSTTNPLEPSLSNPYYYATYLTAYAKRGVPINGTQSYIYANRPSETLTVFLGQIKKLWNARWFIYANKVYFHRKDLIGNLIWGATPALDFTGADAKKIITGTCFNWNGEGKTKRIYITYGKDATDAVGNETLNRYNGEYIEPSTNPNYTEAVEVQNNGFGSATFVDDANDRLYDDQISNVVAGNLAQPATLKITADTLAIGKILIYDNATSFNNAKTLSWDYADYANLTDFQSDDVPIPIGYVYPNYPMSFSPEQNSIPAPNPASNNRNLWQYHTIDVPSPSKKRNIAFEVKLQYCCEFSTLNLYQKVVMKNGDIGEINSVTFDHYERTITIKGNLI